MTDLDLPALRKQAAATAPNSWVKDGTKVRRVDDDTLIATGLVPYHASFVATFDPPTVLALLDRIDYLDRLMEGLDALDALDYEDQSL